jgi:isopentenyl-diphosphate delta-isomerase
VFQDVDQNAVHRKKDHIALAFQSQVAAMQLDSRFNYEPLLSGHPQTTDFPEFSFLGKKMKQRIWISSMTGGTEWAAKINHNLAKAAGIYGFGMGLGILKFVI